GSLKTLDGPALAGIRKKINRFNRDHAWVYTIFNEATATQCATMQDEWCKMRHCDESDVLSREDRAIQEVLASWATFGVTGGVLTVNGKVVGYTFGERLNKSTVVVHVEKANPEYFGAYQIINQQFATINADGFELINREQDLGEEGLRKAKEGYNPVHMVKKYTILFD
nr:phosphatidylglycerol lysyltransferase domain-containing protein [Candidatus Sigynarchaeota archaeon]